MSTGECIRLLFSPYRRKLPTPPEEPEAPPEPTDEENKDNENQSVGQLDDQSMLSEQTVATKEESKEIDIQRSWFNLVCYGLPNLIVSQI